MSPPPVPSNVAPYIQQAAKGTGLPESVVAAQNYAESGYGSNDGPSSTGAMGPWQFEPGTWTSYSTSPFSDASNWAISTLAYIAYMKVLLKLEGGNVRNALAAYNAGPGNLSAGYGYADGILSDAGQSQGISIAPGSSTNTPGNSTDSVLSWPSEITGFFGDSKVFIDALLWIVNPASWLRIGSLGIAVILLILAVLIFTKVGSNDPLIKLPSTIPVPVPV
jgi:transglycosylase-like protein with SLT domain